MTMTATPARIAVFWALSLVSFTTAVIWRALASMSALVIVTSHPPSDKGGACSGSDKGEEAGTHRPPGRVRQESPKQREEAETQEEGGDREQDRGTEPEPGKATEPLGGFDDFLSKVLLRHRRKFGNELGNLLRSAGHRARVPKPPGGYRGPNLEA